MATTSLQRSPLPTDDETAVRQFVEWLARKGYATLDPEHPQAPDGFDLGAMLKRFIQSLKTRYGDTPEFRKYLSAPICNAIRRAIYQASPSLAYLPHDHEQMIAWCHKHEPAVVQAFDTWLQNSDFSQGNGEPWGYGPKYPLESYRRHLASIDADEPGREQVIDFTIRCLRHVLKGRKFLRKQPHTRPPIVIT